MLKIKTDGTRLIDESGRECILHGINLVDKGANDVNGARVHMLHWEESLFKTLRQKGFDLLRLGMTWEGIAPAPGRYNENYLKKLAQIMDWCEENGIYVVLDMHQDLYTSFPGGTGNGAPAWAALTDGEEFEKPMMVWAEGYFFSAAVHNAFDHFWSNTQVEGKGLQDHFADLWERVATSLGDKPALLGFDILNEPFPGSDGGTIFWTLVNSLCRVLGEKEGREMQVMDLIPYLEDAAALPDLMAMLDDKETYRKVLTEATDLVRAFDVEVYAPFLQKISGRIRKVTENGIIFMENCYYSNLGIPCSTPRLQNADGAVEAVFSPHGYDLVVDTDAYKDASNNRVDVIFEEHRRTQERLGIPVIVGEWGGHRGDEVGLDHIVHLYDLFDAYHWSSMYWCYTDNIAYLPLMKVLCRPHPRRVAGVITEYHYKKTEEIFILRFEANKHMQAPTELYLHKTPKEVLTSGSYTMETVDAESGAAILFVTTPGDSQEIKIIF